MPCHAFHSMRFSQDNRRCLQNKYSFQRHGPIPCFLQLQLPYFPGKIDYVTGADLFLKNKFLARFDERFFLYFEETDLQLAMKRNGYYSFLIEDPKIIHFYKKTDETFEISSFSDICSQNSAIRYSKKNLSSKAYLLRFLILLDLSNPYIWKLRKKICPK